MKLRKNQVDCINLIHNHLIENDRGLIKMFCGSGKSLVMRECILKYCNNLCVSVVPSINLITQFNKDYLIDVEKNYNLLTICSKDELKKNITFTTDEDDILKFLKLKNKKIILITYQSLHVLFDVIKDNSFKIDLICFDEAHHILGDNIKRILFDPSYIDSDSDSDSDSYCESNCSDLSDYFNYDESIFGYDNNFIAKYITRSLFFTATPKNANEIKMYEPVTGYEINDEQYEIIDEENSVLSEFIHCGKTIYEYTHLQGVNDNILNDFNVRVDLYTENTDKSIFEAISRSILETGNTRVLTFHARSEVESDLGSNVKSFIKQSNVELFKNCFKDVLKKEFPSLKGKYKSITFTGITASTKNKSDILQSFDNTKDNEIFILASCKTIGEGVDTKGANMIVFIDPKQSYVDIIQNIGRACRKNKNTKNLATVLVPCYVDVDKYKDCKTDEEKDNVIRNEMSKTGNFNGILNVLSALRQEDPYIFELCLKYPETYTDKEINDNLSKNGIICEQKKYNAKQLFKEYDTKYNDNKSEIDNFTNLSEKLNKNIQVINNKVLEDDIFINKQSQDIEIFVKKEDNVYCKTRGKLINNKKLPKPNRNVKPFVHANNEIKVLWGIEGDLNLDKKVFGGFIKSTVIVDNEAQWTEKLNKVKQYIDENNKRPSSTDKDKEIKTMGNWICRQIQTYKKKLHLMKNNKIRKLWKEFVNDDKYKKYFESNEEIWKTKLDQVKQYIDENNKRPSTHYKDKEIKVLATWIGTQQNNYEKNKDIMKDENIKKLWEEFINDDKYKKYFESNEEIWKTKLNQVKQYIDENNKRPSNSDKDNEIKSLGQWINHQQNNYKKNDFIIKNKNIKKLWEEFINNNKYKKYFESNEESWKTKLNQVKEYIDENNKRPSAGNKDKEIKVLGTWIGTQQNNYEKNEYVMKDVNIRKLWEEFVNDDKYKKYFKSNEEIWKTKLNQVKQYIDENNKRPSTHDKDIEIKTLATWISTQQNNYEKNEQIMKDENIRKLWEEFINDNKYKKYFESNEEIWKIKLNQVKQYIDENNKRPLHCDKDKEIKSLAQWINCQQQNYEKNKNIMKDESIKKLWEEFVNDNKYKKYFESNEESWKTKLNQVKEYIDENNKRPSNSDKNKDIKTLAKWICHQQENYKKNEQIMKDENIKKLWEEFVNNNKYKKYFNNLNEDDENLLEELKLVSDKEEKIIKKSTIISPKKEKNILVDFEKSERTPSKYQEITKKMTIQKSNTTKQMFKEDKSLWHEYHDKRDHSFKGYDKQEEIPVNKIIAYLKTKTKHKLKILDLGCGRNFIKKYFNETFNITGYDYVSFNNSIECDISNLPNEDNSVDICVFSQSLMGSNWKEYIKEAKRVLRYNGEMIISESVERYDLINTYINELNLHIKSKEYEENKRWFYLYVIND